MGACVAVAAPQGTGPDGTPCDLTLEPATGPSTQCRGGCFPFPDSGELRRGICGSLVDLHGAASPRCPDGDPAVPLAAAAGGSNQPAGDRLSDVESG